jgi:hypothetical protein
MGYGLDHIKAQMNLTYYKTTKYIGIYVCISRLVYVCISNKVI